MSSINDNELQNNNLRILEEIHGANIFDIEDYYLLDDFDDLEYLEYYWIIDDFLIDFSMTTRNQGFKRIVTLEQTIVVIRVHFYLVYGRVHASMFLYG